MELFVALKRRNDFLDRSTESSIAGSEALKPTYDRVINWRRSGEMPKNVGLVVTDGDKSYRAPGIPSPQPPLNAGVDGPAHPQP